MLHTARAYNGMVVSPHRLASEAGLRILQKGGSAAAAAVATAATLCVVYPHMTGLGGDAFWLVLPPQPVDAQNALRQGERQDKTHSATQHGGHSAKIGQMPIFIDACGKSAALASPAWYEERGCKELPKRGPLAAMTMAGAVSGWEAALDITLPGARLSLSELFESAIHYAEEGFPVSSLQAGMTQGALAECAQVPGFAETFLSSARPPRTGERMRLPALARTFHRLAAEGLHSFYFGALACDMARALEAAGSPLREQDFAEHRALTHAPLSLAFRGGTLFNSPPPTQGAASLMILGLLERYAARHGESLLHSEAGFVHAIVEATKQAFMQRNAHIGDPHAMPIAVEQLLAPDFLDLLAEQISPDTALAWPQAAPPVAPGGDTVWLGVMDAHGSAVSCIQSIYHEFGSGFVAGETGIAWHNRGLGFSLRPGLPCSLAPQRKPFHTLNPAMARLADGRLISYGTMGGEGQPQTQAAIFARHIILSRPVQAAVCAPRWLLGRAWGDASDTLKLEASFAAKTVAELNKRGHITEGIPAFSSLTGHAGMLVRHTDGLIEGGFDPRGDGAAASW